jgi:hypothetical protein
MLPPPEAILSRDSRLGYVVVIVIVFGFVEASYAVFGQTAAWAAGIE